MRLATASRFQEEACWGTDPLRCQTPKGVRQSTSVLKLTRCESSQTVSQNTRPKAPEGRSGKTDRGLFFSGGGEVPQHRFQFWSGVVRRRWGAKTESRNSKCQKAFLFRYPHHFDVVRSVPRILFCGCFVCWPGSSRSSSPKCISSSVDSSEYGSFYTRSHLKFLAPEALREVGRLVFDGCHSAP